jgi:hypothetical protein
VEIMIDQEFTALTQSIRDSAAAEVWKPQLSVLLEHLRFLWAAEPRRLATGMAKVAKTLLDAEQWSEAEPVVNEAWQLRRLHEPDAWTTFNLQSVLGGVWLKLGRAAQAEAMIVAGYQGLQERQDKIPAGARSERLREALDRTIAVYTELQQPEQVAKYQTLRDAAPSPKSP